MFTSQKLPIHFSFYSRHFFSRLTIVALSLLLLGCSAWAQSAGHSSKRTPIPNTKKYRDKGMHPATGRSGSATLTVRALLDKAGNTDIEMTTGLLDSDQTPPGNIKKAQIKALDQDGDAIHTRNYNGLTGGGYFKTRVNDLHHLQQVQVQTNIDGIDGKRTNVVTVVETVKKRPDLALSNLSPGVGLMGTPVNISVLARELNGDVGASANASLYIDGTLADQAAGIYVDANDAVTIAFTHVFTAPGTYQIRVALGNVRPGDYDTSNNEITGSIVITQPNDTLNYSVNFTDEEVQSQNKEDHKIENNDPQSGYLISYGFENVVSSATQQTNFSGSAPHYSAFPYDVSASESNGTDTLSSTITGIAATESGSFTFGAFIYNFNSGMGEDTAENIRVFLSNFQFSSGDSILAGGTSISYERFGGSVTYHSSQYSKYWYLDAGVRHDVDDYTFNSDPVTTTAGTRLPVSSQQTLVIALSSGDAQIFTASPVMPIQAVAISGISSNCTSWRFPDPPATIYDAGSDCEVSTSTITRKTGSASFDGAP